MLRIEGVGVEKEREMRVRRRKNEAVVKVGERGDGGRKQKARCVDKWSSVSRGGEGPQVERENSIFRGKVGTSALNE